jgi:hypothetical protein
MLCPDDDRTRLLVLVKNVDELTTWMPQDNTTDPETLYWIPKYILMRGNKPLSKMGFMSPQFKALTKSQDLIGWRDFTEGYISTHFYTIQSFHLTMSSGYLNIGRTGPNSLSLRFSKLRTLSGFFEIYPSMTGNMDISTKRRPTR